MQILTVVLLVLVGVANGKVLEIEKDDSQGMPKLQDNVSGNLSNAQNASKDDIEDLRRKIQSLEAQNQNLSQILE